MGQSRQPIRQRRTISKRNGVPGERRARRLGLERLECRQLLSAAPVGDLTEGNASDWAAFAEEGAPASVANEMQRVRTGSQSLRLVTDSGFDTGVRYPAQSNAHWDLTSRNYLSFWAYGDNNTPIGFQGNQPVIVLTSPGGSFRYEPSSQVMSNHAWRAYHVPLAGDSQWVRTSQGSPTLGDVTALEIHQDTWDSGFQVVYDGVRFESLDPQGLPPAGPPPPPGLDPQAIAPRVLLYVFDPIMENFSGQRLHQVYGWQDPVALTGQIVSDLATSSHGRLNYQVVETVVADEQPYFVDGFQHTDQSFALAWANRDFHGSQFDYLRFASEHNLAARVDSGEIDEVWLYAPPIGGMFESVMAGSGAYWINGPAQNVPSQKVFPIMGWNYERGVGEAIHSFGHRVEGTLDHIYGTQSPNQVTNWNKFTFQDRYQTGQGGIGNVHFPVNGVSDYDYANPRFVLSNADDWANYPNFQGLTRSINYHEWSPFGVDPQREYLNWWYSHMPHFAGRGTDNFLNNWWRYLADLDPFKMASGNLYLTEGRPGVAISQPSAGSVPSGHQPVRVNAWVDGALGRVDLYVDGLYFASDTLAPFTFDWNTAGLSGLHTLVAKAYELQNGTEGVSAAITVQVLPPTLVGDANHDGVVGAADYAIWAAQFGQSGADLAADFDHNGSVGSGDYVLWAANFGKSSTGGAAPGARATLSVPASASLETPPVGDAAPNRPAIREMAAGLSEFLPASAHPWRELWRRVRGAARAALGEAR